jgi:hypothetical protein
MHSPRRFAWLKWLVGGSIWSWGPPLPGLSGIDGQSPIVKYEARLAKLAQKPEAKEFITLTRDLEKAKAKGAIGDDLAKRARETVEKIGKSALPASDQSTLIEVIRLFVK